MSEKKKETIQVSQVTPPKKANLTKQPVPSMSAGGKKSQGKIDKALQNELKQRILELKKIQKEFNQEIADCTRTKEELDNKKILLEAAIASADGPFFSVDQNYCYTSFNAQHAKVMKTLYGADIEVGHSLLKYHTNPADRRNVKINIDRALNGESVTLETYAGEEARTRHYFEISHKPLRDSEGRVIGVVVRVQDIDDRKKAAEKLQESEARFQLLANASFEGLVIHANGLILDANQRVTDMLGYDPASLIGKPIMDFIDPGYQDLVRKNVRQGATNKYEVELVHKNGRRVPVEVLGRHLVWKGQQARVAAFRDITERKNAERVLHQSEARYRSLVELSPNPIFVNQHGRVVLVNPAAVKLFGATTADQMLGKTASDLFHPDYHHLVEECIKYALAGQVIPLIEEKIVRLDGELRDVEFTSVRIEDEKGPAVQVVLHDITARKRAEAELRRLLDELELRVKQRTSELTVINDQLRDEIAERKQVLESLGLANTYNRSLIEASLDPQVTITPEGKIGDVNNATEKMTGHSRQELIGTDFHSYFSDAEKARAGYQKVFETGNVHDYELEIRHKDGHVTPVIYNASIYRDEAGKIQGVIAGARDITERRQAEAELEKYRQHLEELVQERTRQLEKVNIQLHSEISERIRTEEALLNERGNLQMIFNAVNVGMLQLGADGTVQRANQVITQWTGKDSSIIQGLQPGDALGCIHAQVWKTGCGNTIYCSECQLRSTFESAIKTGQAIHDIEVETFFQFSGGETHLWLDVSADPIQVNGERNVILAINNITARKQAEDALLQARDELESRVRQRTQELNKSNLQLQLEIQERQGLADSLHDAVNQSLFSAGLIAEVLPRLWERDQSEARKSLKDLRQLTRAAQGEMRALMAELSPSFVSNNGLDYHFDQLSNAFTGRTNHPVIITTAGETTLPAEVQLVFYRVCQEALNNIAKHARATKVEIDFKNENGRATMCVSDDGHGFSTRKAMGHHYGLAMMSERAKSIGATLSINSRPGHGTQLFLNWTGTIN